MGDRRDRDVRMRLSAQATDPRKRAHPNSDCHLTGSASEQFARGFIQGPDRWFRREEE